MTFLRKLPPAMAGFMIAVSIMLAILVAITAARHALARTGFVQVHQNYEGLTLGSIGTKLDTLKTGTIDVDNGATSKTLTITGARVGDIALVTPAESLATAAKFFALVTTDSLTVTVNADPQTTVTFNYLIVGPSQ